MAHFRIGDGYGELITQIAREKLIEDKNVEGSIKVLVDTTGMERKMAFEIILGYKTLKTDELTQQLLVDPDEESELEEKYIGYNYKVLERKLQRFSMGCRAFQNNIENELVNCRRKSIDILPETLIPYFNSDDLSDIKSEVDHTYMQLKDYYEVAKEYLVKFTTFYKWIKESKKISEELGVEITEEITRGNFPMPPDVVGLHAYLQELEGGHIVEKQFVEESDIDKYVQGYKNLEKLDAAMKERGKLEPVDQDKKWDAGYIAPNGDYYAVNGEIANMLHLNIADAMVTSGIIPADFDDEVNADVWLERNGWVKQHGDHILYGGYDNSKLGGVDVPITKAQLRTIKYIIRLHYNGIVWPGLDPSNRMSVISWAGSDPLQFKLKWFAF